MPTEISFTEAVKGTAFEGWNNKANAIGMTPNAAPNGMTLKFTNVDYVMTLVDDPAPVTGETYQFSIDMKNLGTARSGARLVISRGCAASGQEYSLEEVTLSQDTATYSVTHTFKQNYPCFTYALLVHAASDDTPRMVEVSNPCFQKISS